MIKVGAAIVDITPPCRLPMAGFAARTQEATGRHDALTIRALVVNDTALVTVDVIGIDATLSRRVRRRCALPDHAVTIVATHTHGGPASMPGRLFTPTNNAFLHALENGIIEAIEKAMAVRQPASLLGGMASDPGYAKNRRRSNGPVDHNLPVLRVDNENGIPIAILTSYACHPVVLGADNLNWTGDYPHYVRAELESALPDAVAFFVTGCAGDVNTGHTAAASLSNKPNPERSFSTAKKIGTAIARSAVAAPLQTLSGDVVATEVNTELQFKQREVGSPDKLAKAWRAQSGSGDVIAHIWADWAQNTMGKNINPMPVRCTAIHWCGAQIIAMPGELFAQTALDIRASVQSDAPLFVIAYADDNPGYIPPQTEFACGGYEVEEAHRFYQQGATFAPGSAERLADAGCAAARIAASAATDGQ